MGLNLYLLFVVSWFLHLPARVPILGAVRADLLLVGILGVLAFSGREASGNPRTPTDKWLAVLIVYVLLVSPFTEWPGSVIKFGVPNFIKAIVFFYFTVAFVKTEKDLKRFILVFFACQLFRVLEPLYLHITQGYWGSSASELGGQEFLDRLAGSPFDVVNPNGLAFVILTVLPILYFMRSSSWKHWLAFAGLTPLCLYALALTGSRSGTIGLIVIFLAIVMESKKRFTLILTGVVAMIVGFSYLSPDMQDRYLSIVGMGEKNVATADERLSGLQEDLNVALRRPLFGYGLGTSAEANANFATEGPYARRALPAHNLYVEALVELGIVGLFFYMLFLKSVFTGFFQCRRAFRQADSGPFLRQVFAVMQVWIVMAFITSFASYGLSTDDWYLLAALSIVLQRLVAAGSFGGARSAPPVGALSVR